MGLVTGPHARTPPHPQPVGSGPRQPAQRAGSRGWESALPRTPHTQARGAPPGTLMPPPQRGKCCTGVKHRSKNLIPDFHEDPENQVLLFGAAPLLLIRELDIHPCSNEGLGHPGQAPLLGIIPLRGSVIPLGALLGVTCDRSGCSSRSGCSNGR